jgi:hypothetical protein
MTQDTPRPFVESAWQTHMRRPEFEAAPPKGIDMTDAELLSYRLGVQEGYVLTVGKMVKAFEAMNDEIAEEKAQ